MNKMRTYTVAAAAVTILSLAGASRTIGAPSPAASCNAADNQKTFKGNVTAVDVPEKTVSVKGFFFTRTFNMANDSRVSLQDKPEASLAELRPGQRVDIRYENDNGVLIAKNIVQREFSYTGHITAIDPAARTLTLREGVTSRNLAIAPDCAVVMKDNKSAGLNSLQPGDAVRVIYTPMNGTRTATRIEQNSATFVGTVAAIDSTTRSVKIKDSHAERKFNLADNCPIVINGKMNGDLSDLRIGDRVSLSYDNEDGVLVANRLSPLTATSASQPSAPAPSQSSGTAGNPPQSRPLGYGYGGY